MPAGVFSLISFPTLRRDSEESELSSEVFSAGNRKFIVPFILTSRLSQNGKDRKVQRFECFGHPGYALTARGQSVA